MFSHVMVGSNDIERAKRFYDALFATLGGKPGRIDGQGRIMYLNRGGVFMISKPIDGEDATHANGGTIGFAVQSRDEAHAWHDAGLANGGTAIEDPPGPRAGPGGELYLAYLRDPDGNKICAMHRTM